MTIPLGNVYGKIIIDSTGAMGSIASVQSGLGGLRGTLASVSGTLTSMGRSMTVGLTLPLLGIGTAAVRLAGDYQGSMNLLQATTGATTKQIAALDALAKQLGADMALPATSATDASEALLELAKAGLSIEESMAAARGVLQLSAAGELSNAEAAEIAANALNAFGLAGSEATRVSDLLAAAANASSADVRGLADALQMSAAVYAAAGVPIEDLTAAIGQMSNAGIQGSDAGTSLKQMLLSLQAPTDKAAALMDELGINVYDAQGSMLPFVDIIREFMDATAGMSDQTRSAALSTIFGSDAIRAANIVLMDGVDAFNEMKAAVTKEGAAAELAEARMKGLRGAFEGLKSQVETLLLTAAEPFQGILENITRYVADLTGKVINMDPNLRNMGVTFAIVAAAAGPVLAILGAMLSPVGLVAGAVAALGVAWATNFGGIRDVTQRVMGEVQDIIANVAAGFQVGGTAGAVTVLLARLGLDPDTAIAVVEQANQVITELVRKVAAVFDSIRGQIYVGARRGGTRGAVIAILGMLGISVETFVEVETTITELFSRIQLTFEHVRSQLYVGFRRGGVAGAAISLLGVLGLGPDQIYQVINAFNNVKKSLSEGFQGFVANLAPIKGAFAEFWGTLQEAGPGLGDLLKTIGEVLAVLGSIILTFVGGALPGLAEIFTNLVSVSLEQLGNVITLLSNLGTALQGIIQGDPEKIKEGLLGILGTLGEIATDAISGGLGALAGILETIAGGLSRFEATAGVAAVIRDIAEAFRDLRDAVENLKLPELPEISLPQLGGNTGAEQVAPGLVVPPGAQYGGSFLVRGAGGIDSQLVRFLATPGERVTVSPPGGQAGVQVPERIEVPVYLDGQVIARVIAPILGREARQLGRLGGVAGL